MPAVTAQRRRFDGIPGPVLADGFDGFTGTFVSFFYTMIRDTVMSGEPVRHFP